MNERLKELLEEATEIHDDRGTGISHPVVDQKVFAELIVRECASIAAQTPCPYFDEQLKQQLGHTWDMACVESAKDIRKHFGVENDSNSS
jgi:hypothetical protein